MAPLLYSLPGAFIWVRHMGQVSSRSSHSAMQASQNACLHCSWSGLVMGSCTQSYGLQAVSMNAYSGCWRASARRMLHKFNELTLEEMSSKVLPLEVPTAEFTSKAISIKRILLSAKPFYEFAQGLQGDSGQ